MSYCLMIVDDERSIREGLAVACDWASLGIGEVLLAADGRQAVERLAGQPVDIVISDIVMPEIDGVELSGIVAREYPHVLFFLLTGHSEFAYAQKAIRHGVRDYILKPSDEAVLEQAVKKAVEELDHRAGNRRRLKDLEREIGAELPEPKRKALYEYINEALQDWPYHGAFPERAAPAYTGGNPTIQRVLDYVEAHLADEELSLTAIAGGHLFMNTDYLGKLFKKEMKQKFSTYLLERRMQAAVAYLRAHPDAKVYEVAQVAGFGANSNYFSTVFKRVTGKKPSAYLE